MRKLYILLLLVSNHAFAQKIVKEYFDKEGLVAEPSKSYYYQVGKKGKVKNKEGEKFIDSVLTFYSASHRIRSREFYKNGIAEGVYITYYENGKVKEKGSYQEGNIVGTVTNWYETGLPQRELYHYPFILNKPASRDSFRIVHYWDEGGSQLVQNGNGHCICNLPSDEVLQEGTVVNGYRDGIWKGTAGDTLTFTEHYENGVFIQGESVYKGSRREYQEIHIQPEFAGGIKGMMDFLRVSIRYPVSAKRSGQQGKVFIRFIVKSDGTLSDCKVIKGVNTTLDAEALRVVVLSSGLWIAAKSRGVTVESPFVLPIYFKLD